jgi:hypothetical protein
MAEDLVGRVLNFFSGDSNENLSDKDVVLRQRHKELGENKYARFFRQKTDEADSSLGQFFYSLYKLILPSRTFMKDLAKMTKLRQVVLEAFMDASIVEIVKKLNPAAIDERAKTTPPAELTAQIRLDIEKLNSEFGDTQRNGINRCYNLVMVFFQLVNFDYPGLLKKFDSNFAEGLYSGDPKFTPVRATLVARDIGEFLAISQGINPDSDWKALLKLIRLCAGTELIQEAQFAQMMIGLRDVINSKILELIVQYGSKNPVWTCRPRIPDEHIAEAWLEARILKAQECIHKINDAEKNLQIGILVKEIFTGEEAEYMENYTASKGEVFKKKGLNGYAYAEGLNYLSAFLKDFLEKGIREVLDILLIRGQWTNNAFSREMSEALHQLLELPASISQLDEMMSDDGSEGSRLKAALIRIDRDRTQARYINSIIDGINDTAQDLINGAAQQMIVIGKHLKNLVEDIRKKHPEMIINWRELNSASRDPLPQVMAEDSRIINCFIQLMHLCGQ